MQSKRKIILLSSIFTIFALTAITSILTLANASLLYADKQSRQITIDGQNTIRQLYQTSTPGYPGYRRLIIFEMLDKQAYGYVTPSQAQNYDDSFLMTMWNSNPAGAGFVINCDEHQILDLYLDEERTQKVEPVKFRNIDHVDFQVDMNDTNRYIDLVATTGELSYVVEDEITRRFTWRPDNSEEYQQVRICAAPDPKDFDPYNRVLWIRSMTFYYSC